MTAATCPDLDTALGIEGFESYRRRTLAGVHRVEVYRNLNEQKATGRTRWSIRDADTGLVVGHADKVAVEGARVHVGLAAQRRIAAGEARTVHAWISGRLTFCPTDDSPWLRHARRVVYRPHQSPLFRFEDTGKVFVGTWGSRVVRFDGQGMWAWL